MKEIEKLKKKLNMSKTHDEAKSDIIDLYFRSKKRYQEKIKKVFENYSCIIHNIMYKTELMNFEKNDNIYIYDFNQVNQIYKNHNEYEKNLLELKKQKNKLLKKLDKLTNLSFYSDYNKVYVTLEKNMRTYKRLDIRKKDDYLKFYMINDSIYGFPGMFFGYDYGCSIEDTIIEDEEEIKEEESPISVLISDLKSEGEIYNFILENYDKLSEKNNLKHWDFKSIIEKTYKEKIKNIINNLELNKIYEINIDPKFHTGFINLNAKHYIKKSDENKFLIFIETDKEMYVKEPFYNYNNGFFTLEDVVENLIIKKIK